VAHNAPRVVVVNDAPAVLEMYREMLQELDYEPVVLSTVAVETDRIREANPDAVVLDLTVGLQTEYGVQMAQELRSDGRYRSIPIVVATANATALDGAREILSEIGVPVLLKPFTVEELAASLAEPFADERSRPSR
jgi:CheY-like chemotaxis protein